MIFLTSPDLGEPKEVWEAWLVELSAMDQRDDSVKFAIRRAEITLKVMAEHQPAPATVC